MTVAMGHSSMRWEVGFPRRNDTGSADEYRTRDWRGMDLPAQTVTEKARSWTLRRNDQGIDGGTPGAANPLWPLDRPATTIAGRGLVPDPGANGNRYNGATKSRNDGYQIEVWEALVLQSFPADYPVQGSRTSAFKQVGNAVPPGLARAILAQVV